MRHPLPATVLITLAVSLSACGAETAAPVPTLPPIVAGSMAVDDMATDDSMPMAMDEHSDGEHVFEFGEPADEEHADRIVDVSTRDTVRCTPDPITVKVGETGTVRITNVGNVPHDVVLDDMEGQDAHEAEMAEMIASGNMTMADEENGFALLAGESKTLTWTFTEAGTVFLGCHQPGHYAAGMIASVTVEP